MSTYILILTLIHGNILSSSNSSVAIADIQIGSYTYCNNAGNKWVNEINEKSNNSEVTPIFTCLAAVI